MWTMKLAVLAVFSLSMMIAGVAVSGLTTIVSSIAARAGITTALSTSEEIIERQSKQIADADVKNKKLNNQVAELGTSNQKLNNQVAELGNQLASKSTHVKNVDEVLQRVVRRTGASLSRELGETAVSGVPLIGAIVAGATIAWDIKDACDTIKDIDYLIDVIELETSNIYNDPDEQKTIIEWCGSIEVSTELLDQKLKNETNDDFNQTFGFNE